ncbi:hypothetical protein SEVIR_2G096100v4 [Setaria viridis]|uniref:Glycosyltransferase n=1 Tax=Setaria viridis TaxID=4556 RepID=A0A4U6VR67_SETVI|nr:DIMBOA UDP-glucosyltransferase BX9-like [Setaria viridis]TKW31294.1 hypothetical protein SEVIR_2G096100v2 [Setaria viridis]
MAGDDGVQGVRDGGGDPRPRRVLVFPLPFQGHIDPMMHLAGALHARAGLAVTVLHTRFNALDPARHPEFRFVEVPDGVPAGVAATGRIIDVILAMNAAMEASPAAVLGALASAMIAEDEDEEAPRAACLVIDSNLLSVQRAAEKLGLPTMVLRTGSAACLRCFLAYPMLHDKGYLPSQESQLYMPVPELPPLRVRDLFQTKISSHEMVREVIARITETVRNCSGLIINTFEALEPDELQKLRGELDLPLLLAAGPLHKLSSKTTGSSLLDQDYSCIEWLDTQPPGSVLYVSFGSLAAMDSGEFVEVAWGLANSGHPFLWVVRPNLVQDTDIAQLPDGFEDAVKGRGMVIQWAPQQEVLAHRAVGGFWTHCGWNSTLESVGEGVPMICRPNAVDQMMNARYVEEVWGVGFELEGELERGEVEGAVRKLMGGGREGAEMTERAEVLRRKVAECLDGSGSSRTAIDKLVDYMLSL